MKERHEKEAIRKMYNKRNTERVNELMRILASYYHELIAEYQLPQDMITVNLRTGFKSSLSIRAASAAMTTACNYDKSQPLLKFTSFTIYLHLKSIDDTLLDCELDIEKAAECLKLYLRHEIGHIISARNLEGQPIESIKGRKAPKMDFNVGKLSYDEALAAYLQYFDDDYEKGANAAVGITRNDLIANFNRLYGKEDD